MGVEIQQVVINVKQMLTLQRFSWFSDSVLILEAVLINLNDSSLAMMFEQR